MDEPEKPDFRFQIPFFPPKIRVNPDFRVFMLDFPPKKPGKTGFSEHSETGFIKKSLSAPPLNAHTAPNAHTTPNITGASPTLLIIFGDARAGSV